jgi:hypothetical protein
MTTLQRLDERVTKLEGEMVEVRFLRSALANHATVLNAIREDQLAQGERITRVETEMRDGFAETRSGFAEMRSKFATVVEGQLRMTELLTKHIEDHEKH